LGAKNAKGGSGTSRNVRYVILVWLNKASKRPPRGATFWLNIHQKLGVRA